MAWQPAFIDDDPCSDHAYIEYHANSVVAANQPNSWGVIATPFEPWGVTDKQIEIPTGLGSNFNRLSMQWVVHAHGVFTAAVLPNVSWPAQYNGVVLLAANVGGRNQGDLFFNGTDTLSFDYVRDGEPITFTGVFWRLGQLATAANVAAAASPSVSRFGVTLKLKIFRGATLDLPKPNGN